MALAQRSVWALKGASTRWAEDGWIMFRVMKVAMALLIFLLAADRETSQGAARMKIIEGVVVSAEAGKLVINDEKYVNHTHAVNSGTLIMVEGKMARLEEIQKGMAAHITLDHGKLIAVNAIKPVREQKSTPGVHASRPLASRKA